MRVEPTQSFSQLTWQPPTGVLPTEMAGRTPERNSRESRSSNYRGVGSNRSERKPEGTAFSAYLQRSDADESTPPPSQSRLLRPVWSRSIPPIQNEETTPTKSFGSAEPERADSTVIDIKTARGSIIDRLA